MHREAWTVLTLTSHLTNYLDKTNKSPWSLIVIIIIMSCQQHGYPWPSLATSPYSSSLLAGLQGYIPYPHRAAVCMFELAVLLLFGHMRGVHRSTSLMSSSMLPQQCPACLARLTWIVFVMGGKWRRCPWCNGYRHRNWTRRHEFKSSTRLIAFHIALIP